MYKAITATAKIGKPDAIVVGLWSEARKVPGEFEGVDKRVGGALAAAMKRAEYALEAGSVLALHPDKGADRVYLIGLGKGGAKAKPIGGLRNGCAKLAGLLHAAKIKTASFELPGDVAGDDAGRAIGEGLSIGNLKYTQFKCAAASDGGSGADGDPRKLDVAVGRASHKGLATGLTVGESANLARLLVATPPNVANPAYLVKFSQKMAREVGLRCRVIDYKQAKRMGMGGLVAVGQAGSTKPAMIVLEHTPRGKAGRQAPIALVGKAITFDTGGYSLKPGASMVRMKYDKSGGMAVLGAMHAIARLKLDRHVVGVIAAAENMVDTEAYRPDDIITISNGVTVEVTNTDAEGRLVLADALVYACRQHKPRAVIDLATLTGGVVVALGKACAGAFVNDEDLRQRLFDAGESVGERLWRLPLWEEHLKQMKGEHSDIVNSAGRDAHPIQGAAFLSYFVAKDGDYKKKRDLPWAHLDIAGVADIDTSDPTGLFPKGPSGFGVRLLVKAIEGWK